MKKEYPIAYRIVQAQGVGAFTELAEFMERDNSMISRTLRQKSPSFKNRIAFTDAINVVFEKNYSREDLFPTDL